MGVKTHGVCLGFDNGQRGEWEQPERMGWWREVEGDRVMGSWGEGEKAGILDLVWVNKLCKREIRYFLINKQQWQRH